ncbi:hypothetical protein ACROYT_G029871 [Oculina patagonica]
MADYSAKVANMARILAIAHIIVGSLLICFGIADRAVDYYWTGYSGCGIWTGVWMCIAGGLGIPGSRKERTTSRNAFAGVFMGFSITSAVFGGIIIIVYSIGIAYYRDWYYDDYDYNRYGYDPTAGYDTIRYRNREYRRNTQMALMALILLLGIVEFAIGIWAAVCLCLMKPCTCCYGTPPQQGQMMHTANPGYTMAHFPVGGPAAIPMQAGGGMVAVQTVTPGAQAGQPQMVVIPVSGGVGTQPQLVQVATSGAMATGYQPQQVEMPQSIGHGEYTRLTNEQDPVKI